jgi:hypothetical protein
LKGITMSVQQSAPLLESLLVLRAQPRDYLDCFFIDVPGQVKFENYLASFYTTWLFKLERVVLNWAGYRSSDQQAQALAEGTVQAFAAWKLEDRSEGQILMRDMTGATCSWLMARPQDGGTRLYFGSGLRSRVQRADGSSRMSAGFRALMGLHNLYSRALLACAAKRVSASH